MDEVIANGKKEIENGKKDVFEYKVNTKEMSIILFTSGTTSISKAVMLSQDNILSNIYSLDCMVKLLDSDVSLAFLPFHHTFGSTALSFSYTMEFVLHFVMVLNMYKRT